MSFSPSKIVTLTTDFGLQDPYVGVVKGVIASRFAQVQLIDLNHEIPPFDILAGAWSLKMSLPHFADGSIHIAVVDPQVGTSQRRIALRMPTSIILAPDNGLTTPFLSEAIQAYELNKPEFHLQSVSSTFHARDVFAHIAAHLLNGATLNEIATEIEKKQLKTLEGFFPSISETEILGSIAYTDRYGNLITNIESSHRATIKEFHLLGKTLNFASGSYGTIGDGEAKVINGSHGFLEIAMREASAQAFFKAKNGTPIRASLK